MRNLLTVCAALVLIMGVVSGNLWLELRSSRQLIVELQDQLEQAKIPVARAVVVQVPPPAIEALAASPVAVQILASPGSAGAGLSALKSAS